MLRHCPKCNLERKLEFCQKCGTETTIPCDGWDYPVLPPIEKIRELAKEVGYAIGVHGTQERNLDLIAAPWTEEAVGNHDLIQHIAKGLVANGEPARVVEIERKTRGRYAASIQMNEWFKIIDLSVCPTLD